MSQGGSICICSGAQTSLQYLAPLVKTENHKLSAFAVVSLFQQLFSVEYLHVAYMDISS